MLSISVPLAIIPFSSAIRFKVRISCSNSLVFARKYSPEVWDLPVAGQVEKTYGEYFLAKTKEFLQDIRTLNLMAEEKGIIANGTEMESIRTAANAFYQSLSEEDKAFSGNCSLKDVVDMYVAYFVAEKTAKSLLANVDTELSAAEAKVISVEQIVVQDENLAKELEEKVKLAGEMCIRDSSFGWLWKMPPSKRKVL